MPTRSNRVCPRCRRSVPPGPCPHCNPAWVRKPTSWAGGSTRRWRSLRKAKLDDNLDHNHGLCEVDACVRLATEVHHDPPFTTDEERYDWDRLVAICHDHHAEETAKQSQTAKAAG